MAENDSNRVSRESRPVKIETEKKFKADQKDKSIDLKVAGRSSPGSRPRKVVPKTQTTVVSTNVVNDVGGGGTACVRSYRTVGSSSLIYHDRPHAIRHGHRYGHIYMDWCNRLRHRIVWPRYRFMVHYRRGPRFTYRYVYPYYHRKYMFVSLGGYWPIGYRYVRYYWYGYHPYVWCGYYPIAREVQGDTYNYYTYNYYYDDNIVASESGRVTDGIQPVDHNTFADIREKLAQQAAEEPGEVTLADTYFEAAVKAFEADDYDVAIEKFGEAMALAPDDIILPFAYSQALVAKEQYSEAADVLREALTNVSPDKEGVFYPRGLYPDDDTLFEQINCLAEKAEMYSFDADLQLLLGYQLLGVGEIDQAVEPLQRASRDLENSAAAKILLNLLEKIRVENSDAEDTEQ